MGLCWVLRKTLAPKPRADVVDIPTNLHKMSENVYCHGGDLGDTIYSLPAIMATGGGHLVLWQKPYVRDPYSPEKVSRIATFFASQPYIKSVQFKTHENPTHNLDDFRAVWLALRRKNQHVHYNLAELHLLSQGLPLHHAAEKWLDIEPETVPMRPVLFNRTFRYLGQRFPWKAVWEKYRNWAAFMGTRNEWQAFQGHFGNISYIETTHLLDAARYIAGCKIFVGNQSALMAIAIGLQVPTILQETWPIEQNCLFPCVTSILTENAVLPNL